MGCACGVEMRCGTVTLAVLKAQCGTDMCVAHSYSSTGFPWYQTVLKSERGTEKGVRLVLIWEMNVRYQVIKCSNLCTEIIEYTAPDEPYAMSDYARAMQCPRSVLCAVPSRGTSICSKITTKTDRKATKDRPSTKHARQALHAVVTKVSRGCASPGRGVQSGLGLPPALSARRCLRPPSLIRGRVRHGSQP
eukprot:2797687-Rhodomonas_salina.2